MCLIGAVSVSADHFIEINAHVLWFTVVVAVPAFGLIGSMENQFTPAVIDIKLYQFFIFVLGYMENVILSVIIWRERKRVVVMIIECYVNVYDG